MLRRAGQVHRQLLEHVIALNRLHNEFYISSRLSPPFTIRWASAAPSPNASLLRTQSASLRGTTSKPLYMPPKASDFSDILIVIGKLLADKDDSFILEKFRASPTLLPHVTHHESARKLADGLAISNPPSKSLRFLNIAHTLGCTMKPNIYEGVCFQMSKKRQWDAVLSSVSLAERHLSRLTSRLLNWRIRACLERENYAGLDGTLEEFRRHSAVPNRRTFHLILSGHLQNSNLLMARQCLTVMADAGCPPDASTDALIATYYRKLGREPHVENQVLDTLPELEPSTATTVLNSLMRIRLDADDLPGALQLLALFNQLQVDGITSALTSMQDVKDQTSVRIKFPLRQKLMPSPATYSIFINHEVSQMNLSIAYQIFQNMLAAELSPTTETVVSLIHLFFAAKKGYIAVRMVARMCSTQGVSPSLFDSIRFPETAEDLPWDPSHLSPNIRVFNALLSGTLRTHGLEGAATVLCIMHVSNVKPTSRTLQILMTHIGTVERSSPGVLLNFLRQHSPSDVPPTLRHLHTLFSSVIRREKFILLGRGWDHTAARYSQHRRLMLPDRPYPKDRLSVEAPSLEPAGGIELPLALSYKRLARPSIDSLLLRKVMSDRIMISLRIRHEALIKSDIRMAKEVFRALLDRGIHPDKYHFSALMEGLANLGDVNGAMDIMRSAIQAGVIPNVVMFTIIIAGHGRNGQPDKAIKVFDDMLKAGIAPDVPSIDAVTSAFFVVGGYWMAKRVLLSLWPYIQPFPEELHNAKLKTLARVFRTLHEKNRNINKTPSKEERLALHLKLRWLKDIWANKLTTLPSRPLPTPKYLYSKKLRTRSKRH